jgi:hypothetical protein
MNNIHGDILHSPSIISNESVYRTKPEETTGGLLSNQPYDYQPHGEVGWICPVCGRGLAPSTSYCPCRSNNNITFLNGGCTVKDILGDAIDCNTTPPKAYYMVSATNATKN